ncbi:MAG: GIY-YIG nuclease family protein [Candidatus Eisenbacteria bacterium]|uniref:GIY-YIG nuclease family protein n=1 Tax=Eiseniibacteriota bacterium TaxID=2212470 RepID=A0A933SEV4_UNCEI|nr:GIY-YIG nuclease family protein [Candidatus Eisenbacteria bacterium]
MSDPRGADRKALTRAYVESERPMGVFRISHKDTGRWFLGVALDVPAMLNRQRFQLDMGSHPNASLQRDWRQFGAEGFAFETLDLLTPAKPPVRDPLAELRTLEGLWRERLRQLYGPGYQRTEKSSGP